MDYRNLHSLDPRQMLHLFIIIIKLKLGFNFQLLGTCTACLGVLWIHAWSSGRGD